MVISLESRLMMVKRKLEEGDVPLQTENPPMKVLRTFSAQEFRKKLHGSEMIKSIQNFCSLAEAKDVAVDVVMDYLDDGGSVLELISLLDITSQADLVSAFPIFRAVYIILVRIRSEGETFTKEALKGVERLLATFVPAIQAMIALNSSKHRKVVFKMLTAIVTLYPLFGREILNWLSLTPQQIEQVITPGPVRKSFVMFLLAFFLEGKASVFKPLMEKKGFLSHILPGLLYDDSNTVCVVLNVLREKALLNSNVSKTLKLNVFNTQILQSLFGLFDWIGPQGAQKAFNKPKRVIRTDEEGKSLVITAVSEFLRVLCTNRKHGVAFWDKTVGMGPPMNQLLLTALEVVPKPWEKEELSRLILEILVTSPDLIKPYLATVEPFFQPRESPTWAKTVQFLANVVDELNVNAIMEAASEVLTQIQIQTVIRRLCFPSVVVKYTGGNSTSDMSVAVRFYALQLISISIKKGNEFFGWLKKNLGWQSKHSKFLFQTLSKILPATSDLRQLWHASLEEKVSEQFPAPKEAEIRTVLADYILQVALLDPGLLDNPRKLCKLLTKDIQSLEDKVKVDVLQAVSLFDPTYLAPDSELFDEALKSLIILSFSGTTKLDSLAAAARMLLSTGLFDSNVHEVDCWAGAWLTVPENAQLFVADFFVSAVKKAVSESGLIDEIVENGDQCDTTSPSALFSAVFVSASASSPSKHDKKVLITFLTNITFKLLHLYGPCQMLTHTSKRNQEWLLVNVESYISQSDATLLLDPFERKLCSWLLGSTGAEVLDISNFTPDLFQLFAAFNIVLFYLKQWLLRNDFGNEAQMRCKQGIKTLLEVVDHPESGAPLGFELLISLSNQSSVVFFHKCIHLLLGDPILVSQFRVFGKKHSTGSSFTEWLREVLTELKLESTVMVESSMLTPWIEHYISQLHSALESKKSIAAASLRFWMKFLQPPVDKLLPLLDILCSVKDDETFPSAWDNILHCVIDAVGTRKISSEMLQRLGNTIHRAIKLEAGLYYGDALLCLLQNIPTAVFSLNSDFLDTVTCLQQPTPSILKATSLYLQLPGNADRLLQIACNNSENSCNPYCVLSLLDNVIDLEGSPNHRGIVVSLGDGVTFTWPAEVISKQIKEQRKKIEEQLRKAFLNLRCALSKSIRKFMRGEDNTLLSAHLNLIRILLRLHPNDSQEQKGRRKSLKGYQVPALTVEILRGISDGEEKKRFLVECASFLCSNPEESYVEVMRSLAREFDIPEAWLQLTSTSDFKSFVDDALRELNANGQPTKIALLNAVLSAKWPNDENLTNIFLKCASHSEFLSIILSSNCMKVHVIELILRLVQRCPNAMFLGQAPAFLAAYTASLSSCDQLILQLLREYEMHCGSLSKFEPLFWGPLAVNHYSVLGSVGLSLWRQVTMKSVLELLDVNKLKKTISDFPINRCLQGGTMPELDVYDPAFLLPLFSNLFSPGAVTYCQTFVHQGALSLTIAALSSEDKDMRAAAAVVICRFYTHLQLVQHSKQKPLWLHVLDSIRFGLDDLEKKPVPSIVSVFLARSILELAEPLGALYSIHNFLLAKPALNLYNIPEFLPLFFSADLHHEKHRSWILEVLRDGMRRDIDLNLAVNGPAFKMILSFFESSLASVELKDLILQVLRKMVQVPNSSRIILGFGLLSWLRHVSHHLLDQLHEPFLLLVVEVNYLVLKEKRLTRIPLQSRLDVVIKTLVSKCGEKGIKSAQDNLKKMESVLFKKSSNS